MGSKLYRHLILKNIFQHTLNLKGMLRLFIPSYFELKTAWWDQETRSPKCFLNRLYLTYSNVRCDSYFMKYVTICRSTDCSVCRTTEYLSFCKNSVLLWVSKTCHMLRVQHASQLNICNTGVEQSEVSQIWAIALSWLRNVGNSWIFYTTRQTPL